MILSHNHPITHSHHHTVTHHLLGLLDPRWIEEQKRQVSEKKTKEEVYAEGFQIGSNLKRLADRRTDIFGAEETVIGRKIGEDESAKRKQLPTVQWDGHSARWVWPIIQ